MRPTDYLRELDVFVYFPHPDLNEAFGRTILEAMFAGVPCLLPRRFSETFGDLALYCEPADVRGVLSRLAADDAGRLQFVRWVRSQVDDHFETTALLQRIPEFGLVDQRVVMSIDCPPDIAAFRLRMAPTRQFEQQRADAA
jgi:glycosyltransferase involved in cell wall biosynthesis